MARVALSLSFVCCLLVFGGLSPVCGGNGLDAGDPQVLQELLADLQNLLARAEKDRGTFLRAADGDGSRPMAGPSSDISQEEPIVVAPIFEGVTSGVTHAKRKAEMRQWRAVLDN
ncbi:unnamed protein product [Vitrella brassicaformis CCMP3155]|uniref:Uncharacterized protein n=1 Tax=Vitrella brassicaformis (strain CCMP3155) TaxID=1169540 RepID=A0A0G4EHT7_VITBC|nr:unnamed protein product [Vitrella brassicaformis CCMP3155]|eukprot:CEL95548.1 unnamed protein product [Vitrella brassicaformis CCMP3155]